MLVRRVLAVVVAGLLSMGFGCMDSPEATPPPAEPVLGPAGAPAGAAPTIPAEDLKALADGNNAFAVDLYKKLTETEAGNIVVSPYSIRTALGLSYAGARGRTANEIKHVLHFTLPGDRLHPAYAAMANQLHGTIDKPYKLYIANALWGQKGYPFRSEFLDLSHESYAGDFREVDFARDPDAARQTINCWVAEKTEQKIKELLGTNQLSPDTRLVVANAIYIKAAWAMPFLKGESKDALFEVSPDEKVTAAMMRTASAPFRYSADTDCQWLDLPYQGNRLSLTLILPERGRMAAVERSLTASAIQEGITKLKFHRGVVTLPRFRVTGAVKLKDQLSRMGMPLAFTKEADFSGMVGKPELVIDNVHHQAYLSVDEAGSEAAAATAVPLMVSVFPPFAFTADRPFLFLLRDSLTGSILFSGRVVRPGQAS